MPALPKSWSCKEGIALELNEQKVGRTLKVIIDREEPDFYVGRTEYDSPEVDPEGDSRALRGGLGIGEIRQCDDNRGIAF